MQAVQDMQFLSFNSIFKLALFLLNCYSFLSVYWIIFGKYIYFNINISLPSVLKIKEPSGPQRNYRDPKWTALCQAGFYSYMPRCWTVIFRLYFLCLPCDGISYVISAIGPLFTIIEFLCLQQQFLLNQYERKSFSWKIAVSYRNLIIPFTNSWLIKHHTMKTNWGSSGTATRILNLALDGGEWLTSRPGLFAPGVRALEPTA
jgi:hypothetical protein